jgi:hypothetical protein
MAPLCLMLLSCLASAAHAGDYHVNLFLGQKMLDEEDWMPIDEQPQLGVTTTFGGEKWPFAIAIDLLRSQDDATDMGDKVEGTTTELDLGLRKVWGREEHYWQKKRVRPFVGGGIALIRGEAETSSGGFKVEDDDKAFGLWANGGVFWRLGRNFNVGVEVRFSRAEAGLFDVDVGSGGEHIGLLLGWGN